MQEMMLFLSQYLHISKKSSTFAVAKVLNNEKNTDLDYGSNDFAGNELCEATESGRG